MADAEMFTARSANLRAGRMMALSLRRQRPDLRMEATDLLKCIENKLKEPDAERLKLAFKKIAAGIAPKIEPTKP